MGGLAFTFSPGGHADHFLGLPDPSPGMLGNTCTGYARLDSVEDGWDSDDEGDVGGVSATLYGNQKGWCLAYSISSTPADGARATHYLVGNVLTALEVSSSEQAQATVTCGQPGCAKEGPKAGEFTGEWPDGVGGRVFWYTAFSRMDFFGPDGTETTSRTSYHWTCPTPLDSAQPPAPSPRFPWAAVAVVVAAVIGASLWNYCFDSITEETTKTQGETQSGLTPIAAFSREVDLTGYLSTDFAGGEYFGLDTWNFYEDWVIQRPYDTGEHDVAIGGARLKPGSSDGTAGTVQYQSDLSPVVVVSPGDGTAHNWDWDGPTATATLHTEDDGTISSTDRVKVDWEAPEPLVSACPSPCPAFQSPMGMLRFSIGTIGAALEVHVVESTLPQGALARHVAALETDAIRSAGSDVALAALRALLANPDDAEDFEPRFEESYGYMSIFKMTGTATAAVTGKVATAADTQQTLIEFHLLPNLGTDTGTIRQ